MSRHGHGVQACVAWVPARQGQIPYNAIAAGGECYIARGRCGGDVVPGKAPRGHQTAYLPWDGRENAVQEYEILCDTGLHCFGKEHEWKHSSGGNVPRGAIIGGNTQSGEPLYIARGNVNGELCVGKVHPSQNCAYFPWGGQEHKVHSYEVLTFHGH